MWHGATPHEVYMRSWLDTDGDGDGDIPGQAGLPVVARRRRDLPVADRALA
jgi:hypothetical protein